MVLAVTGIVLAGTGRVYLQGTESQIPEMAGYLLTECRQGIDILLA
jgi:hypothetical protein